METENKINEWLKVVVVVPKLMKLIAHLKALALKSHIYFDE
jgi:hypothetical protein